MTADQIAALAAGIPTIITAITGLVIALRARRGAAIATGVAAHANQAINSHVVVEHGAFPIQPPTETGNAHDNV